MPGDTVQDLIRREAKAAGIPEELALAVAEQESGFNPTALGPEFEVRPGVRTRAIGTFQLIPDTAARYKQYGDVNDPGANITIGTRYLRELLDRHAGDVDKVLAEYGGVKRNPEYVPGVVGRMAKFRTAAPAQPGLGTHGGNPNTIDMSGPPPAPSWWDSAKAFGSEATKSIRAGAGAINAGVQQAFWHPLDTAAKLSPAPWATDTLGGKVNSAVQQAFWHPRETASAIYGPQMQRTRDAYASGDPLRTGLEALNVPLETIGIGSRLSEASDLMRRGEIARGLGATVDVAGAVAGPQIVSKAAQGVKVVPGIIKSSLNPTEEAAIALGQRKGVPIDVGAATGSTHAKNLLASLEGTPAGSQVQGRIKKARATRLETLGGEMADQVHPAFVGAAGGGGGARTALATKIDDLNAQADAHYSTLRRIAASPRNTRTVQVGTTNDWNPDGTLRQVPVMAPMQLPVSMAAIKQELRPWRDRLMAQTSVGRAATSDALKVLNDLVDGPDFVPAVDLDRSLGAIKALAREGSDNPSLRGVNQGTAAGATRAVQREIDRVITRAGAQAADAYLKGRTATRHKYVLADLLDRIHATEDVQAFGKLTGTSDRNVELLKEFAREAPGEMPKLGRAVLDELMEKAGAEGGFGHAARLWSDWKKLGPETRNILYGTQHASDLDNFFLLHKMLAEHPNPPRTATVLLGNALTSAGMGAGLAGASWPVTLAAIGGTNVAWGGLAALLNSRRGVRLLTQGLTLDLRTPAGAAWAAEVAGLIENAPETRGRPRTTSRAGTPPPTPPVSNLGAPPPRPSFGGFEGAEIR